jgi:hypothetical protein
MKILALLLCLDSCLILLHLGHVFFSFPGSTFFDIGRDWTLGELFQYFKEAWLAFLLLWLCVNLDSRFYGAWSLFFLYLLFDDALMVREWVGNQMGSRLVFEPPFGLRANDVGEMVALAVPAMLLIFIALRHYQNDQRTQAFSRRLVPWLVLLGSCGIVADMIHVLVKDHVVLDLTLELIEDGGEMIVMSFLVWQVVEWHSALDLRREVKPSSQQA